MITIGMNYRVLPGKTETFEVAFGKVLKVMGGMEGHSESHLFKEVGEERNYLIVSDWSSEEDFRTFVGSEKFRSVTDWGKEQVLAGRPSHTVYKR